MKNNQAFKLSIQGKIASAVSIALIAPVISGTAVAGNVHALGQTSTHKAGSVDVVDIANPNANGLSHNQYTDFNVGKSGLVLNNSENFGRSELAGYIRGNNNLDESASVILNEVVSNNPSLLLGQQEVFGMAADVILANPNGITGKDIGFINTNRASLVVGAPTIEQDRLAGFNVGEHNSNELRIEGDIDSIRRLDLIAPTINVNGDITASDELNVISGRNDVDYDTLAVSKIADSRIDENHKDISLDGSVLGSMKAGRIRVHNTDSDATQQLQGQFIAQDEFAASADNLVVNNSDIDADSVSLTGASNLYVGGEVKRERERTAENTKTNYWTWVKTTRSDDSETQSFEGSTIQGGDIEMAGGNIAVEGSDISGSSISAVGDNIKVAGVVTTNKAASKVRDSKGLWFNETVTEQQTEQFHDSSLSATGDISLTSNADLSIAATSVTGNDVALTAGNDLTAKSLITENSSSNVNSYKNETAKLKTGKKIVSQASQADHGTTIMGADVRLSSGGNQRLEGVQLDANHAVLQSGKDLTIGSTKTNSHNLSDENFLYWGGIGGGETNVDKDSQTSISTSNISANTAVLNSQNDLNVSATNVNATGDLTVNAQGDLNITHEFETLNDYEEARHGTAFNITDLKSAKERKAQTTHSSSLSGDKVTLTGSNIAITGSDVTAEGDLSANTSGVLATNIANATDITTTEDFDIRNVQTASVSGDLFGCDPCGTKVAPEDFHYEASSALKGVTTITTKGTGDIRGVNLAGQNATLGANEVDLKGTNVIAEHNIEVMGNSSVANATGEGLVKVDSQLVKSTGPEIYVKGGLTGIEFGIGLGHDQLINEHHEYKAADSSLVAGNNINVTAQGTLTHTGTQIDATNVGLSAKDIVQQASYDRIVDRDVIAGGDVALKLFADINPIVGASIGISGEGVGRVTENNTAITTNVQADDNINIHALNTALDAGTNLSAEDISILANDYTSTAAYDSEVVTTHSGSAGLSVSATTSTFTDVTLSVDGEGEYQYRQTGDATALQGNVSANNVDIDVTNNAHIANNFEVGTLDITAGNDAVISQSDDKQWDVSKGGHLGVSGGVTFSGSIGPAVSAEGGFNFLDIHNSQAKATTVDAYDVNLEAGNLALVAGTDINAGSVVIKGKKAHILAAQDVRTAKGASMHLEGGYSGSINGGADLSVIHEVSNQAGAININAYDLTVEADAEGDALVIEGANINAGEVNLSNLKGNVFVKAAKSLTKVGDVFLGANVGFGGSGGGSTCGSCGGGGCGSCGGTGMIPTSVGAQMIVKAEDSVQHELGSINSNIVNIDSGKDIAVQGNIFASQINLDAGKDISVSSAQDKVNKVFINQGISLGIDSIELKDDITADDLIETVDATGAYDNFVDINLAAKSKLYVDDQKVTKQSTLSADRLKATAGSGNFNVNAAQVTANSSDLNGATVIKTNNDDYVHKFGFTAQADAFKILGLSLNSTEENIKDAIDLDLDAEWSDIDRDNTQAYVSL